MSDEAMERLLAYHGRRYCLTNGWSLRFRVWCVERRSGPTASVTRSLSTKSMESGCSGTTNSHKFRRIRVLEPYAFVEADTLLTDFFEAVRRACQMEGVGLEIEAEDVFEGDDDKEDDDVPDTD